MKVIKKFKRIKNNIRRVILLFMMSILVLFIGGCNEIEDQYRDNLIIDKYGKYGAEFVDFIRAYTKWRLDKRNENYILNYKQIYRRPGPLFANNESKTDVKMYNYPVCSYVERDYLNYNNTGEKVIQALYIPYVDQEDWSNIPGELRQTRFYMDSIYSYIFALITNPDRIFIDEVGLFSCELRGLEFVNEAPYLKSVVVSCTRKEPSPIKAPVEKKQEDQKAKETFPSYYVNNINLMGLDPNFDVMLEMFYASSSRPNEIDFQFNSAKELIENSLSVANDVGLKAQNNISMSASEILESMAPELLANQYILGIDLIDFKFQETFNPVSDCSPE